MEILNYLKKDFEKVGEIIETISIEMLSNSISRYPIFIATIMDVEIGIHIANPQNSGTHFIFKATFLEELIKKGVIEKERSTDFKLTFKDPQNKACVLLITPKDYQFIFLPYDLNDSYSN